MKLFALALSFLTVAPDSFDTAVKKKGFGHRLEELRSISQLESLPERQNGKPYDGPIIDSLQHVHIGYGRVENWISQKGRQPEITAKDFPGIMKSVDVKHAITMETPRIKKLEGDDVAIEYGKKHTTYSAFCSPHFVADTKWDKDRMLKKAPWRIDRIDQRLTNGECIGVGEVGIMHWDKTVKYKQLGLSDKQHSQKKVTIDIDHPNLHRVFGIVNKHRVPIFLHVEPYNSAIDVDDTQKYMDWYQEICRQYPHTKFILSHNSMMEPEKLDEVFDHCDNFYSQVKIMQHDTWRFYWKFHDLHIVNDMDYRFKERWAKFIEKWPDRMMYGSDIKLRFFLKQPNHYNILIGNVRTMVGGLDKDVQQKFMYGNAKKVFNLNM